MSDNTVDYVITTDEQIEAAKRRANTLVNELLDELQTDPHHDPADVAYRILTGLVRYLARAGLSPEKLARDVAYHAADERRRRASN
jgi:hypothetical protein